MSESANLHPNKELRFVTSAEQMIPYLKEIYDANDNDNDNDDDDKIVSDTNYDTEQSDGLSKVNEKAEVFAPAAIDAVAESATIALPNIHEEYVNFIDLSVLNPIIDAADCQPDTLIESEISEPCFIYCIVHCVLCIVLIESVSID